MLLVGQDHAKPVVFGTCHVSQKHNRLVHMTDDQVGPTVVVQVADGQTASLMLGLKIRPSLPSLIAKLHAPLVLWITLVAQQQGQLPDLGARGVANNVSIGNDNIFPAVVIEVEETCPEAD